MPKELKGIPVAPLTGVLDVRSTVDAMPKDGVRMRQNLRTTGQGKLRRGSGWQKLLSHTTYTNEDLHDQLLALSGAGIRQPVTLIQQVTSTRRGRSLLAATQGTVFLLNEHTGNWRVLGGGYGGTPSPSATAPRMYCAQVGDYVALTNDYDKPMWHVLEQSAVNTPKPLNAFQDFETIGLRRAAVVWSWHNCLFFADVEMDGERYAHRVLWSDFNNPTSFDPAVISSIAGSKDLFTHEQILAGKPGLGNTFLIYTTHGIWEMSVVGGDQSFAFRRIYNGEDNEGVAVLKYRNTLVEFSEGHLYGAEDGIYVFNQFAGRPSRVEWLHRSVPLVYDGILSSACSVHVARHAENEVLFSVANASAVHECPNVTLRINLLYKVVDFVDAGFTAIDTYRAFNVPTIRSFIIDNGICDLAGLEAQGYGYGSSLQVTGAGTIAANGVYHWTGAGYENVMGYTIVFTSYASGPGFIGWWQLIAPDTTLLYTDVVSPTFPFPALTGTWTTEGGTAPPPTVHIATIQEVAPQEALPSPLPSSTAAFAPQSFYTSTPTTIAVGDKLATAKTPQEYGRSANVATLKVVAHGYSSADTVLVAGMPDASFNVRSAVITVTDADHFTYVSNGGNVGTTAVATPSVRLLGAPREATAIVLVNGTVTVRLVAHGFSTGQKIRVSARLAGNPLINGEDVSITVLDANNFTYATLSTTDATRYPQTNIVNVVPNGQLYTWGNDGGQVFTGPLPLVTGLNYYYIEGVNEMDLHLTGPNTDLTTSSGFVWDGAGFTLYGRDRTLWSEKFVYNNNTGGSPASTEIRTNNTDPTLVTHIKVNFNNSDALDVTSELKALKTGDILVVHLAVTVLVHPPYAYYRILGVTKHSGWIDYQVVLTTSQYVTGSWPNTDLLLVHGIPASQPADTVTANIATGLKVVVSAIGDPKTVVSASRNDPDNADVVRMRVDAHGFVSGNLLLIEGMSDTGFNALAARVTVIQNLAHPGYSVTDANHFTFRRIGNVTDEVAASSPAVSKITQTNVTTEDWQQTASDSDSLCALMGGLKIDDICRKCEGQTLLVAAASADWCLKQLTDVFYRERCVNVSAVGSSTNDGYASSPGSYVLDGYDSILRFSPMFVTQPGQPLVSCTEFKLFYSDVAAQTTPSVVGLRVGLASQPRDPNVDACGIVWYQHSTQAIRCLSNRTEAQHKAANTQPAEYCHWNFFREGRYLYTEIKISGVGGDAVFNSIVADAKNKEADNF